MLCVSDRGDGSVGRSDAGKAADTDRIVREFLGEFRREPRGLLRDLADLIANN